MKIEFLRIKIKLKTFGVNCQVEFRGQILQRRDKARAMATSATSATSSVKTLGVLVTGIALCLHLWRSMLSYPTL